VFVGTVLFPLDMACSDYTAKNSYVGRLYRWQSLSLSITLGILNIQLALITSLVLTIAAGALEASAENYFGTDIETNPGKHFTKCLFG
jgi:hypothetical protein